MRNTETLLLSLILLACCYNPARLDARNCTKGIPCGNGCIAKTKTCRIEASISSDTTVNHDPSVIRRSTLKLPKVYQIIAKSVEAVEAPHSTTTTAHYKQGQKVFVYKTENDWARISNMQPEEWVELKDLRAK